MYNIKRDGVEIASVEKKIYTDTGLTPQTDYTYTVEIDGVEDSSNSVTTRTTEPPPPPLDRHTFVSNKTLTWDDLPAKDQPDNDSLTLLSDNGDGTYTYEADFEWDNSYPNYSYKNINWLLDVLQFKDNQLKSGVCAFYSMRAAELTALPDLDTSNLTDMSSMFLYSRFNQPLNFDTSNVTTMERMFDGAAYFTKSLNFDTSNVADMSRMFSGAYSFNQSLNNWNTSSVKWMEYMFEDATSFNQPLDNWDTSNVGSMKCMFSNARQFNQNISGWCVYRIRNKPEDFDTDSGFTGQTDKQPKWGQPC